MMYMYTYLMTYMQLPDDIYRIHIRTCLMMYTRTYPMMYMRSSGSVMPSFCACCVRQCSAYRIVISLGLPTRLVYFSG